MCQIMGSKKKHDSNRLLMYTGYLRDVLRPPHIRRAAPYLGMFDA